MKRNKLVVFKREDGKWTWSLHAGNGQVVATDGGQGYESKFWALAMGRRVARGVYGRRMILDTKND